MRNSLWGEIAHTLAQVQRQFDGLGRNLPNPFLLTHSTSRALCSEVSVNRQGQYQYRYSFNGEPSLEVTLNTKAPVNPMEIGTYRVKGMANAKPLSLQALYDTPSEAAEVSELWGLLMREVSFNPVFRPFLSQAWNQLLKKEPDSVAQALQEVDGLSQELNSQKNQSEEASPSGTTEDVTQAESDPYRPCRIERQSEKNLSFEGKLLAAVTTSWHMGRRKTYAVFQTRAGNYVYLKRGESLVPGESTRNECQVDKGLEGCMQYFGLDNLAKALYAKLNIEATEFIA